MVVFEERKPDNHFGVGSNNTIDLSYSTVTLLTFCWGGGDCCMYCRMFKSITVKPLDVSNAFTPRKLIMKTKNVSRHYQMSVVVVVNCFYMRNQNHSH